MIRFCDKEVFGITLNEFKGMNASQLLEHFIGNDGEYRDSVIFLYDNAGEYYGMITYDSLCWQGNDVIIRDFFVITETFWDEARRYFSENPDAEIPVFSKEGDPLTFCYYDKRKYSTKRRLKSLETFEGILPESLMDVHEGMALICIYDLNEIAWDFYRLVSKYKYPICVIGEQWEWFGIKTMLGYNECPTYAKMHIYAEGTSLFRGKRPKEASCVDSAFRCVNLWLKRNRRYFYTRAINSLLRKGITVCKVVVPEMSEVDKKVLTKGDLLNKLFPLELGSRLSQNEEIRERQRDFLGDVEYARYDGKVVEKTDVHQWQTVFARKLKGEKLSEVSFSKRIYIIGPCIVENGYFMTDNTLVAYVQMLVSDYGYEVIRALWPEWNLDCAYDIENIPIKKDDVIIFIDSRSSFNAEDECFKIDLKKAYNVPRDKTWFRDGISIHVNGVAHKVIAQEIFKECEKNGIFKHGNSSDNIYLQKGEILSDELQQSIFTNVDDIAIRNAHDCDKGGRANSVVSVQSAKTGSIVMNCNPFTKGHQYLIEQAASQVDYLYIFVVQEDKSFFTFEDRFELVKAGTAHLDNVIVVPSGEYVLSYKTLPVYFEKEEQKTAKVDATHDVEIFARYIAPRLGITCRFAGEEPIDMVTKQYNEQMASILPEFGIEFIEIPRKVTVSDNEVISASRVRKLMKEDKWEEIKNLVPMTTYEYLLQKYADGARSAK